MSFSCPIVILFVNKPKLTTRCIQSVVDTGYPLDQIRLIDNGSNEYSRGLVLRKYPNIKDYRLDENKGYSGGFNFGLRSVFEEGFDSAFFLTNDTKLTDGAVETCGETAKSLEAGILTPGIYLRNHTDELDSFGGFFDKDTASLGHHKTLDRPSLLGELEYVPGTALWISRDAFENIGGTDVSYHTYWEDVDLSFRARAAGIRLGRCGDAKVLHGVGETCHKKPLYTAFYFQRNRIRFIKKHFDEEYWKVAKDRIEAELRELEMRWEESGDEKRLGYLHLIRTEELNEN